MTSEIRTMIGKDIRAMALPDDMSLDQALDMIILLVESEEKEELKDFFTKCINQSYLIGKEHGRKEGLNLAARTLKDLAE